MLNVWMYQGYLCRAQSTMQAATITARAAGRPNEMSVKPKAASPAL